MSRIAWRWEEKDFGFRFRSGTGRRADELYQAAAPGDYYVVPRSQRKLSQAVADRLAGPAPTAPRVVANPWQNYQHSEWDQITAQAGSICINWAGCLDKDEIARREDEGVQRAQELIAAKVQMPEPAPISLDLIRRIHVELLGSIYPFAGQWRTVTLMKGQAVWNYPATGGIDAPMAVFARDVLSRTPFLSDDDDDVVTFVAELMGELIAIHPFREGNGRTAFIVGDLVLLQNGMLPLTDWRKTDEARYFAACDAARLRVDYAPLAGLIREWESDAMARWEAEHG